MSKFKNKSSTDIEYVKLNGILRRYRLNVIQTVICCFLLFLAFFLGQTLNKCDTISNELLEKMIIKELKIDTVSERSTTEITNTARTLRGIDYKQQLRNVVNCLERDIDFRIERRGNFWVLKNYFRATIQYKCYETITYTTHGDFTFLDNVVPLLERWMAPISMSIYCPGTDYIQALESVLYLRNCIPQKDLIRKYVTFHFYFDRIHTPKNIIKNVDNKIESSYKCKANPPFVDFERDKLYKTQNKLFYPVNVGRNIAREAATTHFIFPSDIELYPNPGLAEDFLQMYSKLHFKNPNQVFVLPIFEVEANSTVPTTKTELLAMLKNNTAIPFHYKICSYCHLVAGYETWKNETLPNVMSIHSTAKRQGKFYHWEPIYICTHKEPLYEEKLTWEGKSDKMTQGYILCVQDYDFHVLSNGFLVHRPGIKTISEAKRPELEKETFKLIRNEILPQIEALYGKRNGCKL